MKRRTFIALLATSGVSACSSSVREDSGSAHNIPEATEAELPKIRPLVGLIELPQIFGRADPAGPPGQVPPAQPATLRIFPAPNRPALSLTIRGPDQIEARAHGYEELSAVVYSNREGWYEIGLRGLSQQTGWVAPKDAGTFRSLEMLLLERLNYVTLAWDRRLWKEPTQRSESTVVPGSAEPVPSPIKENKREFGFWPGFKPNDVKVLEAKRNESQLWVKIELIHTACSVALDPEVIASGWVPAYSASGHPNVWFYARGC